MLKFTVALILLSVTPYISGAVLQKAFKLHEPVTEIPLVPSHAITKPEHAHPHINRILGNPIPVPSELFKAAAPLLKYLRDASVRRILSRTPYGVRERYNFTDTSMMESLVVKGLEPIMKLFMQEIPNMVVPQTKKTQVGKTNCDPGCVQCLQEWPRNCWWCLIGMPGPPCWNPVAGHPLTMEECTEQFSDYVSNDQVLPPTESPCD